MTGSQHLLACGLRSDRVNGILMRVLFLFLLGVLLAGLIIARSDLGRPKTQVALVGVGASVAVAVFSGQGAPGTPARRADPGAAKRSAPIQLMPPMRSSAARMIWASGVGATWWFV
ncbi:hypothetical protein RCH23_000833 [Cryobacterium sp. CAN_C3]|nr:hypothetical protein [Cryobacterium sp. CAN_C3]